MRISKPAEKKRVKFGLTNPAKYFIGRQEYLENIHKFLTEDKKNSTKSHAVSITGVGGVGKTELALKYAKDYINYYNSIVFINSEKRESIERSFISLAKLLCIPVIDEKNQTQQDLYIQVIVKNIYRYFDDTKLLIIFDNVQDFCVVNSFIHISKNISILITSHNRDWNLDEGREIESILLERFRDDEALDFAKNFLRNEEENDVKTLIEILESLPLAMKQALGYIEKENKINRLEKITVKKYLELYEKENQLLIDKHDNLMDDVYNKIVAITCTITIKKIEENMHYGQLALKIFHIMAYLSPEKIDIKELFSDLVENDKEMWEAVKLLQDYSMIHLYKGFVHIHRIVQKVIRNRVMIIGEEENVLKLALGLINGSDFEDHAISIWEQSSQYTRLIDDFYSISHYGRWKRNPLYLLATYRNDCKAIECIFPRLNKDIRSIYIVHNFSKYFHPLNTAAEHGNINVVKFFVENTEILIIDVLRLPMNNAAINGHKEVVQFLQSKIIMRDLEDDKSIYDKVSLNGHNNIIEILKPSNNEVYLFYASLMSAFLKGHYDIFKLMIESVNEKNPHILQHKFGYEENSILHVIAGMGNIEIVEVLLNFIDVNICNKDDKTPIHCAAEAGSDDVLIFLIERGAHFNSVSRFGCSLLHYAARACKVETLKMLIEKGLNCYKIDEFDYSPIYYASFRQNHNALRFFIGQGMQFDTAVNKIALLNNLITNSNLQKDTIIPLIELGANINIIKFRGFTALSWASLYNKYDIVETLLKAGADPNLFDPNDPQIALHKAVTTNCLMIAKLLLKNGAKPNTLDKNGRNALHIASDCKGKLPVVELLVRYGCDIWAVNKDGKTPLDLAICNKKMKIAHYLKKQMDK
ncbi:uncharacterized protein LOC143910016 [Arctopsyche grandis]|uniref:uncharacterized protein LOC143910016 n=1 Tax=Arctopsyche grandis TaxID=121162 RepID=UPI00406D6DCE